MSIIIKQEDLIDNKFLNIHYKLNGRDTKGIDCLGLVAWYLKEQNIDIPDTDGGLITKFWWRKEPDRYIKNLLKYGDIVPLRFIQKNDIVLFHTSEKHRILNHIGIMVNSGWFLHVQENGKSEVVQFDKYWLSLLGNIIRIGNKNFIDNRNLINR